MSAGIAEPENVDMLFEKDRNGSATQTRDARRLSRHEQHPPPRLCRSNVHRWENVSSFCEL